MTRPIRIAWFSPLNIEGAEPTSSNASFLTDELLPLLCDQFEIELFYPGFKQYREYPTHNYLRAYKRHQESPFDLFFYQLEDKPCTSFCRIHLGLMPGIVYLHDYLLSDDGPEPILNSPWTKIVQKYQDGQLPWPVRSAEYKKLGPVASREAGLSLACLFSCPRMHAEFVGGSSSKLSRVPSRYLPLPAGNPNKFVDNKEVKGITVAFSGTPRIEHRAHKLLAALEQNTDTRLLWLIDSSETAAATAILKEFNLEERTELLLGRSPAKWHQVVQRADVVFMGLFSVFGQYGPYLQISMLNGVPALLTDFGASEYLPSQVVCKIQPGEGEAAEISAWLEKLSNQSTRITVANNAHSFAAESYSSSVIAAELSSCFRDWAVGLRSDHFHWQALEHEALQQVLQDAEQLLARDTIFEDGLSKLCQRHFKELGW